MQMPLQITFRDIERTEAIESYVRSRADKLERLSSRIISCHVTIAAPHRHKRHGRLYGVRIEIGAAGGGFVVTRDLEDLYATVDAAFESAARLVTRRREPRARAA